ncbi:DUF4234 domain-containing protein [Herbivorax sp. ANBcel31]|uniref:DUF4234 domain-containing protein n=1 Tax=Herbivorax sp. ANBcel31 TaxID=3069754 RepID=UPI0027AE7FF6|nr:DUF4234 domain-containing protein [Herbivorax sp. ANBcel31]MDQ2088060.1 DUF4234 domain-containing protein [Herbivorax sp. ANBcel31]
MENRSVGMSILLSVVTCGIYSIYWMYKVAEEMIAYNNEDGSPGLEVLLSFVTCGIYYFYWNYKMGKRIYDAQVNTDGVTASDDSVLYVLLSIFGLGLVSVAIMQSNMNKLSGSW